MKIENTPVGIIGVGELGRSVSQVLVQSGNWTKVKLASKNFQAASSLVMDLTDMGSALRLSTDVRAVPHARCMLDCDPLIITLRARFTNRNKQN